MKRKLIFLLGMGLFALYSCTNDDYETSQKSQPDEKQETTLQSKATHEIPTDCQIEANEVNQFIIERLCPGTRATALQSEDIRYPTFWGGSYITPNGSLTILFKGDSINVAKKVYSIKQSNIFHFKRCKFTYNELLKVVKELDEKIGSAPIFIKNNICGYGILDAQNVVEVSLVHMDNAFMQRFKRIYNHPALTFVTSGPIVEEAELNPGGYLTCNASGTSHGSFAFRARETNGQKRTGMVTAGHVLSVNQNVYVAGKAIGTCTKSQNSGSVDAAFVPIKETSFEPSNYIVGTYDVLSTSTSLPAAGTFVNMRGSETGTSGKGGYIKSTNYKYIINGVTFTNLTTATYDSKAGDSGGIIYTYVKSSNTRYTVGIHKGTTKEAGVKVFTKANLALKALGVERY